MSDPGRVATLLARPAPLQANAALAIGLSVVAMFMFTANDTLGKWLVATYSPAQVLLLRSLAILAILLPLIARDEGLARAIFVERPRLQIARVALSTVEVMLFYVAVGYLPLADIMAYYLAAPIFIAAMSPILLGEHVGWRRWAAVLVGFAGVLIILAPTGAAIAWQGLLALTGSVAFAVMIVLTRKLSRTTDKALLLWHTAGAGLLGALVSPFAWTPPSPRDYLLLALLGVVAMFAHLCMNRSLKLATAATIAPVQYTLLLWAIVLGYVVFGDVPTPRMLVGAAIIVAAGLFILWRERNAR